MKKAILFALAILAAPTASDAAGGQLRREIGEPLQQALALARAGNLSAADAKIKQADSIPNKTDVERAAITDVKRYMAARQGK